MTNWLKKSGNRLKADLDRIEFLRQRDMDRYHDFVNECFRKQCKKIGIAQRRAELEENNDFSENFVDNS